MKKCLTAVCLMACLLLLGGCGPREEEPREMEIPVLTAAPEPETQATAAPAVETQAPAPETTEPPTEEPLPAPEEIEETQAAESQTGAAEEAAPGTVSARVANTPTVNVRTGPSTQTRVVKKLRQGDEVQVSLAVTLDKVTWARIEDGWVSTDYLSLDGPIPPIARKEPGGTPGVIFYTEELNVRAEPSLSADKVDTLHRGDVVVVYETRNGSWGRTDGGWVGLDYVVMEAPRGDQPGRPLAGSNGMTAPPETQAHEKEDYPHYEQPEIIGPFDDDGPHIHPDYRPENQRPCQHPSWKHYKHFDANYKEWEEVTCQCGHMEASVPGWDYHSALASREEPGMHSTYTRKQFKELTSPPWDLWECESCGVVKRTENGEKP